MKHYPVPKGVYGSNSFENGHSTGHQTEFNQGSYRQITLISPYSNRCGGVGFEQAYPRQWTCLLGISLSSLQFDSMRKVSNRVGPLQKC
jgi:hypothetical protein